MLSNRLKTVMTCFTIIVPKMVKWLLVGFTNANYDGDAGIPIFFSIFSCTNTWLYNYISL